MEKTRGKEMTKKELYKASDIHSYTVFANIHKRDTDKIEGHMLLLSKEAYETIESIVLAETIKVKEFSTYEVQDD